MQPVTPYSKRIHAAIARSKLSQREIAERARVKRSYVAALATGGMGKPDPVKMTRVADVLGIDARELLALTDQLGAVDEMPPHAQTGDTDIVAAIDRLTGAVERQAQALEERDREHDRWVRGAIELLLRQAGAENGPVRPAVESAR